MEAKLFFSSCSEFGFSTFIQKRDTRKKKRERERERVEFGERATTEYPQTHAKNVRVRFRVENLSLETSPD